MARIIENEITAQADTGVSLSISICVRITGLLLSLSGVEEGGESPSGAHIRTERMRREAEGSRSVLIRESGENAGLWEEVSRLGRQHGANAVGTAIMTGRCSFWRTKMNVSGERRTWPGFLKMSSE